MHQPLRACTGACACAWVPAGYQVITLAHAGTYTCTWVSAGYRFVTPSPVGTIKGTYLLSGKAGEGKHDLRDEVMDFMGLLLIRRSHGLGPQADVEDMELACGSVVQQHCDVKWHHDNGATG